MEMKQKNSQFPIDYKFGKVRFRKPTPEEDMEQGIDGWINDIPIFWRRRRIPITKYRQISIRESRSSGAKTDYQKFLDGAVKAQVCVFEFLDAVVICLTENIIACLKRKQFEHRDNPNGTTSAIYINLNDIPHLFLERKSERVLVETEDEEELPNI